ncbi:MAG: hypothetical protein ACJ751_20660 [Niastella sp.]|uniref:hypothetical protein n=1 Tax=Niastella sp. TaxID=1869183 RepID=UPI00389B25C7
MQKSYFLYLIALGLFTFACRKDNGTPVENYAYGNISVNYRLVAKAPTVTVTLDGVNVDSLLSGNSLNHRILLSDKEMTLQIKRKSSDSLLLDTTFVPSRNNDFTIFIVDALNYAKFYNSKETSSVSIDSNRFQLLNNVKIGGVGRKVNFRFFAPLFISSSSQKFDTLPIVLRNVPFGELSDPVDFLKSRYPKRPPGWTSSSDQSQTSSQALYIRAYDAATDTLLIGDLRATASSAYGRILPQSLFSTTATSGGKYKIVNVATTTTTPPAFVSTFAIYDMQ